MTPHIMGWLDALIHNRVHERLSRVGETLFYKSQPFAVWSDVERWRWRASFTAPGTDRWHDGPAARRVA